MSGLPRVRLLTLLAAAAPADDTDPLLGYRLDGAAAHARAEERIRKAAVRAFGQWTTIVAAAVLDGRGLTATPEPTDPTDQTAPPPPATAPDPYAAAALGEAWGGIAEATIVAAVDQLLGEAFAEHLTDPDTVSARAWAEDYLADVSNRLSGIPNQTFDTLRGELQAGHDSGESIPQLRDRVAAVLSTRHGGDANDWRMRATRIARTETTAAISAGHIEGRRAAQTALAQAEGIDPDSAEALGDKVWIATLDDRTRLHHRELDGQRVPLNEPFTVGEPPDLIRLDRPGDLTAPPSATVNCLVPGSLVRWTGQQVLGSTRRRYSGPLVEIHTARGHVLTVTPNHPVLTPLGYLAAGQLRPGQQVIASGDPIGAQPEVADGPARVDQLHASLREAGVEQRVVGRRVDFHGDGTEGEEVQVVRAYRDLGDQRDPQLASALGDGRFMGLGDAAPAVSGAGAAVVPLSDDHGARSGGPSAPGLVRSAGVGTPLLWGELGSAQPVGLTDAAHGQAQLVQPADDGGSADAEVDRHLRDALALGMTPCEVVQVYELPSYHGDVYNLSTTEQWYSANGIACHNCRCTVIFLRHGQDLPQVAARQMGQDTLPDDSGLSAAPQSPTHDDPAGAPSNPPPSEGPPMPRTWRSNPFLAPFAVPTGDGRIFKTGALVTRALPLPLLFQDSSAPGHDQSTVVGRILNVEFTDEGIVATGDFLDDPAVEATVGKAVALVNADLGHVSVDLAACTGELVDANGAAVSMEDIFDAWDRGEDPTVLEQVTSGELIAATMVATPAFGVGAKITMADLTTDATPGAPVETAAVEPPAAGKNPADAPPAGEVTDSTGAPLAVGDTVEVDVPGADPGTGQRVSGAITAIDAGTGEVTVQPDGEGATPVVVPAEQVTKTDAPAKDERPDPAGPGPSGVAAGKDGQTFDIAEVIGGETLPTDPPPVDEEPPAEAEPVAPVTDAGDLALLEQVAPAYDEAAKLVGQAFADITDERVKTLATSLVEGATEWRALLDYGLTPEREAMIAAATGEGVGPMAPPAEWFDNPKLSAPTPITVTDDGRVFGHAAIWGTCHVGFSNTCVTPPPSASSYAYFHTGEVVTADGSRVAVGNLTLGGRHADVRLAYRSAIEHYDVRGAGVAVVRMYEDEHGIAFAGALTPACTQEQKYDLMRAPVSGDWRRVGGNLEMIGCLSVNAPGFPTPRFATDTAGRTALTAAPSVRPTARPMRTRGEGMSQAQIANFIQSQISKEVAAELGRQRAAEQRAKRLAAATLAVKGNPRDRMAALAASVDGGRSAARRDRLAELAGQVG